MQCCLWTENPHHILVFAWAHRQPGSKLPCDSTPCFPGSRWRSSPSTRCSLTSRPWAASWPRRRFLLLVGSYLSPTEPLFSSFTRLTDFGVVNTARRCSQSHASLFVHALRLRGNGLISVFFFSDLCLDQVEKTVSLTCGSLSSYMFHPASFKSTWLQMFLHILGLWTFFSPLCIFRRWPGILRISLFFRSFSGVPEACKDLFVKSDGRAGSSVAPLSPLSHLSLHGDHRGKACRQR